MLLDIQMDADALKIIQDEVKTIILDMVRDAKDHPDLERYADEVAIGMTTALKTGDSKLINEARAQALILLETGQIIVSRERARMVETVLYAVFNILLKVLTK